MFEYFKNSEKSLNIDEDILYEYVLDEMQFGKPRKGLLTKAVLESNGDDDKAKSLYLQYRVVGIKKEIEELEINIHKIDKAELFLLIENDFKGYKKSSKILKKVFYFFLFFILLFIIVTIYLFLPQNLINFNATSVKEEIPQVIVKEEKTTPLATMNKQLDGIRDKYGNQYLEVASPFTKRVWLDRNLGATKVCESYDDEKCFGDYFQWGRGNDGHEKADSILTKDLSSNEIVEHNKFIIGSRDTRYDWLNVQNNTLWQGLYGENNPCPQGFRLPTAGEYKAEIIDQAGNNQHKIYKSFLKLPTAGYRNYDGVVNNQGFDGRYWTSSRKSQFSLALISTNGGETPYIFFFERSNGYNVRCIKDDQ